jgi:hypothetical protein
MRWRIVPASEADEALTRRWRALSNLATIPNSFMEPEFVLPASRYLPEARGLQLLLMEEGDSLVSVTIGSGLAGRILLTLVPLGRRAARLGRPPQQSANGQRSAARDAVSRTSSDR